MTTTSSRKSSIPTTQKQVAQTWKVLEIQAPDGSELNVSTLEAIEADDSDRVLLTKQTLRNLLSKSGAFEALTERKRLTELKGALRKKSAELQKAKLQVLALKEEKRAILRSHSWLATQPIRDFVTRLPSSFRKRVQSAAEALLPALPKEDFESAFALSNKPIKLKSCLIVTPPHSLPIASAIAEELREVGFSSEIRHSLERQYEHEFLFVISPNVFEDIRPDYFAFQLEQSTSARWFNDEYLDKLSSASAILDYSIRNVTFLRSEGIPLQKAFYVPIAAAQAEADSRPEKTIDVLFYGDHHCPRRRAILSALADEFDIHIESNLFGEAMREKIRQSKVVLNIHYYDDALLETTRICECLALGTPVVSETAVDMDENADFQKAVFFAKEGDVGAIRRALRNALSDSVDPAMSRDRLLTFSEHRRRSFSFYFRRFLFSQRMIGFDALLDVCYSHFSGMDASRGLCLTLAETPERRDQPEAMFDFPYFEGLRASPGWIGCGLSYKTMMYLSLRQGLDTVTVCEDDVVFPPDYAERHAIALDYLAQHTGDWDLFSGFIADISPETQIIKTEEYNGVKFIWVDRTVSLVYNVYTKRTMEVMCSWDYTDTDAQTNTIDRCLQKNRLRVVFAFPFLVGHAEDKTSTLWGFQNTAYNDLIRKSELVLSRLLNEHERKALTPPHWSPNSEWEGKSLEAALLE